MNSGYSIEKQCCHLLYVLRSKQRSTDKTASEAEPNLWQLHHLGGQPRTRKYMASLHRNSRTLERSTLRPSAERE